MMGELRRNLMRVVRLDSASESFTRVPNAIFSANLTPAMERAWIRLASLDHGEYSRSYKSIETIAEVLGYNRSALFRVMKDLKEAGLLLKQDEDLHLVVPSKPIDRKTSLETVKEKERTIAEEMEAKPRRVNSISEKEAKAAFIKAWNSFKPEKHLEEGKTINPATWIAVEIQAKRLGIEREDYADFVKTVCRGLKADNWWSSKSFKVSNVFGYSAEIEDKKFQSVERLYKQGQTKEAKSAAFTGTEEDFLDWYTAKGFPVEKIEIHQVTTWNEGLQKEQEILKNSKSVDRTTARVYYADGKPVFWSGKMNQKALYYLP